MLLFVPTSSFEGFGEHPYDPSNLSHLLAGLIVIVSVGALTLTSLSRRIDAVRRGTAQRLFLITDAFCPRVMSLPGRRFTVP